jgi:ABC-type uncharacterized transport system ATPase subunit
MSAFLEVEGLYRSFGGVEAVAGLDLVLEAGGLLALIGPNGCGKTTLFELISGGLRPDSGRIRFQGRDIAGMAPWRIARLGILRKFQTPRVFAALDLMENLSVPLAAARRGSGSKGDEAAARLLLRLCRLEAKASLPAADLSHGERQWLEIAMLLTGAPRLMLLDEPTAGMSVAETRATVELLRRIHALTGIAILVVEHDLGFVQALDSEVAVMLKGRILSRGGYAAIRADPLVRAAYLGKGA